MRRAGDLVVVSRERPPDTFGAPWKKNAGGAPRAWDSCCKRPAPIRSVPFSYLCTCWKLTPTAWASFLWLMPKVWRRTRILLPIYLSIRFEDFFVMRPTMMSVQKP